MKITHTCTKSLAFCAAHALWRYKGDCANIHGHNYRVEITVREGITGLDGQGMVRDFKDIKQEVGIWIDKNWDHALLIYQEDKKLVNALLELGRGFKLYYCAFNPTAENMANHLLVLFKGTGVIKVRVYETDTCWAQVELDDNDEEV